jgi:hypothetical protein
LPLGASAESTLQVSAPNLVAQQQAAQRALVSVVLLALAGGLLASVPVAAQVAQLVSPSRLALPNSVEVVVRLAVCGLLVSSPRLLLQPVATLSPELAS